MRTSNIARKAREGLKRRRQKEIIELKGVRDVKRKLGEVITKEDYHPSGHVRHGK